MKPLISLVALAALLAACSEKPQLAATAKSDARPWQGADPAYQAAGWKPGDATSWEQQMRQRAQGQNEYSRSPAAPR